MACSEVFCRWVKAGREGVGEKVSDDGGEGGWGPTTQKLARNLCGAIGTLVDRKIEKRGHAHRPVVAIIRSVVRGREVERESHSAEIHRFTVISTRNIRDHREDPASLSRCFLLVTPCHISTYISYGYHLPLSVLV